MIKIVTLTTAGLLFLAACANNASREAEGETSTGTRSEQTADTVSSTTDHAAGTQAIPAFKITDVNGTVLDLTSFKGKKVFVNLWASWCPPCRHEMPSIEKLYKATSKDKAVFIMLALDDDFEKSKKYIQSKKLDLPVYYPAENLPALFNVRGIPTTFIFNESGELIERIEGAAEYNTNKFKKLLGS